jgi:8-oxo-dGTP diphosphatase
MENYTGNKIRYTEKVKGRSINLILLPEINFIPKLQQVTSVAVFPMTSENHFLAVNLPRGLDIPGGHVEKSDTTIYDTARRETYEEAYISLDDNLKTLGVISSDYNGDFDENITYMVILIGKVKSIEKGLFQHESTGRKEIHINDFLSNYSAGSSECMQELLLRVNKLQYEVL